MSDLLSIGASGVRAYQTALTTTSENIANAGVDGYSRRVTTLRDVSPSGTSLLAGNIRNGAGVAIVGIERAGDQFRATEARIANADVARSEASIVLLETIERALAGSRLSEGLAEFFNAAQNVAADPASLGPRAVMLDRAEGLAGAFASAGAMLDAAMADLDGAADQAVRDLNSLAASLANVNAGLGRAAPGTSGQAGLLDERDRLLDAMSALIDVDVATDEYGRASVRVGGASGPVMVAANNAGTISYARNAEGAISLTVTRDFQQSPVTAGAGAFAGLVDGAQRIADAGTALDALAAEFVAGVDAIQAGGEDLDGNAGAPIFAMSDGAASMTMVLDDPRGIAAAAPGGGERSNANLAALAGLRTSGGFEAGVTELALVNASALNARKSVAEAQGVIRDQAVAARDALSGVNLDEEAVDLMRFQQAYQASSRIIQVARETLDALFAIS